MEIFLGGLPINLPPMELSRLFGNLGFKTSYRIYRLNRVDGQADCYSRISVHEGTCASSIIAQLMGLEFHGRKLEARPFVHRNVNFDRRAARWRNKPWPGLDRRRGERRTKLV